MSLVDLTTVCTVEADCVESVFIQHGSFETGDEAVIVVMQSGEKFRIEPGYQQSIWDAKAHILTIIREAQSGKRAE